MEYQIIATDSTHGALQPLRVVGYATARQIASWLYFEVESIKSVEICDLSGETMVRDSDCMENANEHTTTS